jgi:UDP-2-acetamido-3-amino-2,3-dideoxy-glucuronate N-acetyltransferase
LAQIKTRVIGDNCKVQNNVSIYNGVLAGNNVFFGPSCVLTNDINPRCEYSKNGQYMKTILENGVTLELIVLLFVEIK